MSLSPQAAQKIAHMIGTDAAQEVEFQFASMGGAVVHLDGDETIGGRKTFSSSIDVNGAAYDWPESSTEGVLANDGRGRLSWSILSGVGTVTSVGLIVPDEYIVSGSPISSSGNIVLSKAPQVQGAVYAGPVAGGPSAPSFRHLAVADVPVIPMSQVAGLETAFGTRATVKSVADVKADLISLGGLVDSKAAHADVAEAMSAIKSDVGTRATSKELAELWGDVESALAAFQESLSKQFKVKDDDGKAWGSAFEQGVDAKLAAMAPSDSPTFTGQVTTHGLSIADGSNVSLGVVKGTRIGKTRDDKMAFYGMIPVAQPGGDVVTALANLGLVKDPTISQLHVIGLASRLDAIESKLRG